MATRRAAHRAIAGARFELAARATRRPQWLGPSPGAQFGHSLLARAPPLGWEPFATADKCAHAKVSVAAPPPPPPAHTVLPLLASQLVIERAPIEVPMPLQPTPPALELSSTKKKRVKKMNKHKLKKRRRLNRHKNKP